MKRMLLGVALALAVVGMAGAGECSTVAVCCSADAGTCPAKTSCVCTSICGGGVSQCGCECIKVGQVSTRPPRDRVISGDAPIRFEVHNGMEWLAMASVIEADTGWRVSPVTLGTVPAGVYEGSVQKVLRDLALAAGAKTVIVRAGQVNAE